MALYNSIKFKWQPVQLLPTRKALVRCSRNVMTQRGRPIVRAVKTVQLATSVAGRSASSSKVNHVNAARYSTVPPIAEQTREIRKRVIGEHLAGGLIYLEGGDLVPRNGCDVFHRFRVHSSFAYLTGVQEPGFACVIDAEDGTFTLLTPKHPLEAAFWVGHQPSLEEMAEHYGADRCCYMEDLGALLASCRRDVHTLPEHRAKLSQLVSNLQVGPRPMGAAATVRAIDSFLEKAIRRCRGRKTDAEVACLLRANEVSGRAHMAMWGVCTPGLHEYNLEATFTHSSMQEGLMHLGYPCIVGSGTNSAILHYEANRRRIMDGDLVMVDAGAEFRCYTADISRTFPANGIFSEIQRDIYNVVLQTQECALSEIRPGVTWSQVDATARRLMLQLLRDLGLVKGQIDGMLKAKVDRVFMPHGLGHHLGLDVHDVSATGQVPENLLAGHVITCEPGVYFIDSLIEEAATNSTKARFLCLDSIRKLSGFGGVRIEDNVLVESAGSFNITMAAEVPKTADAVCEVMQRAKEARSVQTISRL